jgi:phospholipase C
VPYQLQVHADVEQSEGTVRIHFANTGTSAAVFQVRSGNTQAGPWSYTVGAASSLSDTWEIASNGLTEYDLSVYGPNGFLRQFRGSVGKASAKLLIDSEYEVSSDGIVLLIENRAEDSCEVSIADGYTNKTIVRKLKAGETIEHFWQLEHSFGWYDLRVTTDSDPDFAQRLCGHVETGRDSFTDPAIGATTV